MSFVETVDNVGTVNNSQIDDAVPVEGTVKWFDPVKGYGFIIPDDGGVDILVHHSTLRRDGHDTLYPAARVKCTVIERVQGLQADRVIAVDNSQAQTPDSTPRPTAVVADIENISEFRRAHVKWFNRVRGFGFVNIEEGGHDIFVHMEILRESGMEMLVPGQFVMVRFGAGPRGLMVTEVKRIDGGVSTHPSEMVFHEEDPEDF